MSSAVIKLVVDEKLLHPDTHRIVVNEGKLTEVAKDDVHLVHHELHSLCVDSTFAVWMPPCKVQAPINELYKPPVAPSPVVVEYNQTHMKAVYSKLKQAASKGCGDVDAATILKLLQAAEM